MNTLINRFFTKNGIEPAHVTDLDDRLEMLQHFIDKGSSSARLDRLLRRISRFSFPIEEEASNMSLVQLYLELENYLIYHDPRYISSEEEMRAELQDRFPEISGKLAFEPLFHLDKNQSIVFRRHFLQYVLNAFADLSASNKLAESWKPRINFDALPREDIDPVKRISINRKLRELSEKIYNDFVLSFGAPWVEEIYNQSLSEYLEYYKILKTVGAVEELTPFSERARPNIPIKTVSPISISTTVDEPNTVQRKNIETSTILQNILDGYVLFDSLGNLIDCNNKSCEILSFKKENLGSQNILKILPPEIAKHLKTDLDNLNFALPKTIIGKRHEIVLRTKNGDFEDFELSFSNNYSEPADSISLFLKDITHRTDTLKAINEAKANAERMAKAKSTFLSNMSHEIRTPLNVILGLSEIIGKGNFENEVLLQKNIEGIEFSAKNLLSIVNDILDFSKIEAGKLGIQEIDFNPRKLVDNLANGFEIKAIEKGIQLKSNIDETIPNMVVGDQFRVNQILTNLIGNAIKFTQKGSINIDVQLLSENDHELQLNFKVTDTGIGISSEKLERIFDSFYQVEDQTNSKIKGTGLGLAISKELVELQGGSMKALSTEGTGSTFDFVIPFKKSKLKSASLPISSYVKKDEELTGLRVLVAEDNQMNQFYIKQLLGNLGVEVSLAENGKVAVDTYIKDPTAYDLILMDMHMPIMNGIEAITKIREHNLTSLKKVPIVACSADVFPEARKNAIKAGIDFYLTKPLNEDAVKEVLFWLISDQDYQPEINNDATIEGAPVGKTSHVNISKLMETFDNDEEFIISLLEIFIKVTPEDYKSMRSCIDKEFYARASSLAHKMKSSFMNLGMTVHGHHLQQIESNIAKRDGVEEAKKHLSAFASLYTKALLEVNILLIELRQNN